MKRRDGPEHTHAGMRDRERKLTNTNNKKSETTKKTINSRKTERKGRGGGGDRHLIGRFRTVTE